MSELPKIAKYKPYYHELKKGRRYLWCSCGLSNKQPFCDGSHKGTNFLPVPYVAEQDGQEVLFCGCKHSSNQPFCDGAHNNLEYGFLHVDPNSDENAAIPEVRFSTEGLATLDGGCYVCNVNSVEKQINNNLKFTQLVGKRRGAHYQSIFYFEVDNAGSSPANVSFGDSEVILMVSAGQGTVTISGSSFALSTNDGVYIRAGEVFSLDSHGESSLKVYLCVCPQAGQPEFVESMPDNFDTDFPNRVVATDSKPNQVVGDRFFQLLVNKDMGSTMMTQFIGRIPPSMSEFHRHLYEETLIVLNGHGYMWTGGVKTRVTAGNVIFLPRKQLHSLQCVSDTGMMLAGFIYPGDNPSINY